MTRRIADPDGLMRVYLDDHRPGRPIGQKADRDGLLSHILGLIHEGQGVAAKTLESLGISLQAVRQQVEEIIGRGERPPSGYIEFTPGVKTVLALTKGEARRLGHDYIGTEHILLGLIGEGEGVAAQVLVTLGADEQRVRQQVIQVLHDSQGKEAATGGGPSGPASHANRRPVNEHENRRLIDELVQRVSNLESWLAAIERHPDAGPGTGSPGQ